LNASLLLGLILAATRPTMTPDIIKARDLCYYQQYDSALALTSAVIARDSTDPMGYYWRADIIQLLIFDSGKGWLADSFYALSDRVVRLCQRRLAENPRDAQAHFYFGLMQLNRSSFLGWQHRTLTALRVLFDVTPHLKAALAIDSSLTDAKFGLGMIEYFKATSDRYTLGIRLFGSRTKAYATVRPLADRNGLLQPMAQVMLAYMLKADGDYDAALGYCRRLLAVYPGNRCVWRMTRDIQFEAGHYAAAVQVGAELDTVLPKAFPQEKYCVAENWVVCGKAYAQMGDKEEARERLDRVIAWERYQDDVPWLAHYVREAKQWRARLGS
jgi:tetratricopeptide (TPR) repeat protein